MTVPFTQTSTIFAALAADIIEFIHEPLVMSVLVSLFIVWLTYVTFMRHLPVEPAKLMVVITGCDSGFGLGTAQRLSALGYKVVATCMTKEGLENLNTFTTGAIICDVTKEGDVQALGALVNEILNKSENREQGLRLWTVINNAGIAPFGCVDWMPLDAFKLCIEVNYYGPLRVIHQFLPLLKQTKNSRIINLSSVAGMCGGPFLGPYGGSKHALEGMGKCLREELIPFGIHVCHINPGVMNTTLIPTAMNLSTRYFHEAPISITSQYDYSHIENTHSIAQLIKENPVVVINAVVETVTLRWPSFWNYTGLQAQGLKYFTFLPREILEFIQVLVNPAPRPVNNNNDYHCKPQQQQ